MRLRALPILALVLAAPAFAADDTAEVRAAARAFDEAQQHGDGPALQRMLAPDFLFVRGSGRVGDARDFIAGFTAPGHRLEPFTIVDPLFVRVSGDAAIVGGEASVTGSDAGKPFVQHFRYSDVFARRDGRWVVVYEQVTGLPVQ